MTLDEKIGRREFLKGAGNFGGGVIAAKAAGPLLLTGIIAGCDGWAGMPSLQVVAESQKDDPLLRAQQLLDQGKYKEAIVALDGYSSSDEKLRADAHALRAEGYHRWLRDTITEEGEADPKLGERVLWLVGKLKEAVDSTQVTPRYQGIHWISPHQGLTWNYFLVKDDEVAPVTQAGTPLEATRQIFENFIGMRESIITDGRGGEMINSEKYRGHLINLRGLGAARSGEAKWGMDYVEPFAEERIYYLDVVCLGSAGNKVRIAAINRETDEGPNRDVRYRLQEFQFVRGDGELPWKLDPQTK